MFTGTTFFPDGSLYDSNEYNPSEFESDLPNEMIKNILNDGKRRKIELINNGLNLSFVWTGNQEFAASTILINDALVNTGIYVPFCSTFSEEKIGFFVSSWRKFSLEIGAIKYGQENSIFDLEHLYNNTPFLCSINWLGVEKEIYDEISYFDLYIAKHYFGAVTSNDKGYPLSE